MFSLLNLPSQSMDEAPRHNGPHPRPQGAPFSRLISVLDDGHIQREPSLWARRLQLGGEQRGEGKKNAQLALLTFICR